MLKIRTYLVLMVVAILLPVVVFSTVALQLLRDGEREAALRGLQETARATALTVDRELASSVTALELLARSPYLESGDLEAFHKQAALLNKRASSWIVLLDKHAQQLVNTAFPFGEALPAPRNTGRVQEVMATQNALASDLMLGQLTQQLVTVMYVPVPAHGGTRYVLAQVFAIEFFNDTVFQPNTPSNWVIAIIGRDGRFIARNLNALEQVGKPAKADLMKAAGTQDHGLIRHDTLEGTDSYDSYDSYDAFTHSAISGWTIGVAAPVNNIEATAGHAVAIATLGLLIAITCAMMMAVFLGRRLVRSIAAATDAATDMGQGIKPELTWSNVLELDQLHTALMQASVILDLAQASNAQAEDERERLLQEAYKARLRAETESTAKDEFLAMLGHELRNPLAAIGGAIALSERHGHASAAAAEARAIIQRQSGHLSHLIDDLLDASRMVGGKITLKPQPVELGHKTRSCLESLRATGHTAGYELKVATELAWVNADPTRLEQMVNNLLVNAFKFTPPGGRVEVTVSACAQEAVLTVKDSGMGISPALLPHVFEMFVQGAASLERAQGGLGIGLALVRQLARLHGGTVSADSAGTGQGSTFVVRLPRIAAPVALQCAAALPASAAHRHWRILLIEDNDDARQMMRRLLDMEGHEVFEAATGTAGLHLASLQKPDLAIVDIGLPEMTGYEVAEHLRGNAETRSMGLIAMTGYGQQEDRKHALAAGFDVHLVKSVDIDHLLEVIDQCGHAALLRKPEAGTAPAQAASPG